MTGDAQALVALVREATAAGIPREALHLGLGSLPPQLRQAHHERLVEEALVPALSPSRGRLFTLPNGDRVVVAPPGPHLAAARGALAELFGGMAVPPPLALLRLPAAAAVLLAIVEISLAPPPVAASAATPPGHFPSIELAAVERALAGASLDRFIRRARVCRLGPDDAQPAPLWTEITIDTPAVYAALLPGIDPAAAPALADRLHGLLDRRLVAELASPRDATRLGAIGLTLGLGSIGEPAFLRLDAALGTAGRARTTLWFAAAELLADPAGWGFVRSFAAARGYRLGLDAPAPATATLLPPERVGAALVRLRWTPELPPPADALPPELPAGMVVLAGVDRAAAIGWGWEAGVTRFEGRLLEGRGEGAA